MTESVFIIHYVHKHGDDITAYSTLTKAEGHANAIIMDRAADSWDNEDLQKLHAIDEDDLDKRLALFREIEKNVSYGENIFLFETDLL